MPYNCLIVDDEALARELIEIHLSQLVDFKLVASCESALAAQQILQKEKIDLIFLDIEMPQLKGTQFIKNLSHPPKVIFTTAYRDYAVEGFELNAVDYLIKPIEFERFFKGIERFLESRYSKEEDNTEYIFIQKNKKHIKILLNEIRYIESQKDYIHIHFLGSHLTLKKGITAFSESLDSRFLRVHRSFIVNKDKITAFTKNDVEINEKEIPIGEFYKKEVLDRLQG